MSTAITVAQSASLRARRVGAAEHDMERGAAVENWLSRVEEHPSWEMLSQIKMTLRAEVALESFRVRDLLALAEGQVFEASSPDTEDVPIRIGNVQLGWGEFEVVEQQMALRVTRLD